MRSKIKRRTFVYVVISVSVDSNINLKVSEIQHVFSHLKDAQIYVDNMKRYGFALMYIKKFVLL